jgi:hypothetical protein
MTKRSGRNHAAGFKGKVALEWSLDEEYSWGKGRGLNL